MWTDTMITMLPMITVHAQNLKAGRKTIIDEPFVDSHPFDRFPMFIPVVADVIDTQKKRFSLSATGATITTVSHNNSVLQFVVVVKTMGAMFICMIDIPLGSTYYVGLSIFTPRGTDVVNGLNSPTLDPFLCASLALVPSPTANCVGDVEFIDWLRDMTFFAFSIHGILQMIFIVMLKSYYENQVKEKAQRLFRKEVGPSGSKRRAPGTGDEIVCSCR